MENLNKIKPESAQAFYNKGNSFYDLGQHEQAIYCYDQAIKLQPDYADSYYNKGHLLNILGKLEQAIYCYDQAIKINPDYASAYNNKGNLLRKLGKYEQAIHCFDQAIKLQPDYAGAYLNKGSSLDDLGQYKQAIDCHDKVIKLKPDHAIAYNNKGISLENLCQYEKAIDCYDQAIQHKPDYAIAYNNKGISLKYLSKFQMSIDCYDQAIKIKPDYATAYSNKGISLKKLGKLEMALDCYHQAIKLNPEYCLCYCIRGNAYQFLNNNDKAISDFKKAKNLFDQGKVEGLSKANITYIEETLSSVIKLLDVAAQIDLRFTGLSRKASFILNEESEELKKDVQKAVTNLTKNFDIDHKEINNKIKPDLQETNQILKRFRHLEAKIDLLEKKNNDLEEQLQNKQDNHLIILDKKLANLELTSQEKEKLIKYFKEFSNYLEQNYVAAVAISSGKIEPEINDQPLSLIGPVFQALEIAINYVNTQIAKNRSKCMADIAHNISAFNDIIGTASIEITLQKRQEILTVKKKTVSGFVRFLQKTKDWVDQKFLSKIKDAPTHLKPVIELAAKDATMLVAACLLGKITLESDDANYTATKQKFIDLVVLNKKFKNEFDDALITKQTNQNDICSICQVF